MKIGVDLRCLSQQPLGGIARATQELWETWQEEFPGAPLVGFFERNAFELRRAVKASRVDRLFCPTGAVPPFCPVPAIPWVHDLAIFEHPEWFPQPFLRRTLTTSLVLRGIRRAPKVFAVSEDTKRAIIRLTGVSADRIEVTGEGVISHLHEGGNGRRPNTPYALILGTVEPRKQPSWVAGWWEKARAELGAGSLSLVVAGPIGWGKEEERLRGLTAKATWFQRLENVDEGDKVELIKGAACVLLPSFHEGFGRVALEAMALGTPVLASSRGALPEVVGEGGYLLDPEDETAWIMALGEVLQSGQRREFMVEAGKRQVERFSWSLIARQMLASLSGG